MVLQPDAVPGLALSVDWYRSPSPTRVEAPSAQSVAEECVDLSTIVNPFCPSVQRTLTGNFPGSISQVTAKEINVASFSTDGVDVDLTYHMDTKDVVRRIGARSTST